MKILGTLKNKVFRAGRTQYRIAPILLLITVLWFVVAHKPPMGATGLDRIGHLCTDCLEIVASNGFGIALLAIAAALVLSVGSVDISTAGVATLSGVIFAMTSRAGFSAPVGLALGLGIGCLSGAFLGFVVVRHRAPALIASWALSILWIKYAIYAAGKVSGGQSSSSIGMDPVASGFWAPLTGSGFNLGLTALLLCTAFLASTRLTGRFCAVGANRDAAQYAGISPKRTTQAAFVTSGLLAGAAGILMSAQTSAATTRGLQGVELTAVSIAVLGGTAMSGGYLSLFGVTAGAFFWVLLKANLETIDYEPLRDLGTDLPRTLFALLLITLMWTCGRFMQPGTSPIHSEERAGED